MGHPAGVTELLGGGRPIHLGQKCYECGSGVRTLTFSQHVNLNPAREQPVCHVCFRLSKHVEKLQYPRLLGKICDKQKSCKIAHTTILLSVVSFNPYNPMTQ